MNRKYTSFPWGRINEYEKIYDGLKREILEETGLKVLSIYSQDESVSTAGDSSQRTFITECVRPFAAYQTLKGPADSFGLYFICTAEGSLSTSGNDTADIHWTSLDKLRRLIEEHRFSEIDLPAALMFLRDCDKLPLALT